MLTEQDRAKQLGEAFVAGASEIGLALLRVVKPLLGLLDDLQDRRVARAVAKDFDSDVDLVRPRIGLTIAMSAMSVSLWAGGRSARPRALSSVRVSMEGG